MALLASTQSPNIAKCSLEGEDKTAPSSETLGKRMEKEAVEAMEVQPHTLKQIGLWSLKQIFI